MRARIACLALVVAALAPAASGQDRVMMQGFYWDAEPDGVWYDTLTVRAARLGWAGFDAVWIPPPTKGASGGFDVGYTPYDYYDLGAFDSCGGDSSQGQGACIPTRYGTAAGLKDAVDAMHAHGLEVYADVVLNHRSGGSLEDNAYGHFYDHGGGSLYSESGRTYTAFPLRHGSGRVAWADGDEFFFPNGSNNPANTGDFYSESQLAGFHRLYTNSFAYDNALHDGAGRNLALGDSLIAWGDWLTTELGIDGYRFDFVKGLHPDYLRRWVDSGAMRGKFHVHELYDGDTGRLRTYLDQLAGSQRAPAVFDFSLRFSYRDVLDNGAPITRWHADGLLNQFGVPFDQIVTFVDNHDFDRTNHRGEVAMSDHSPVVNDKMLAYAHMLTHPGMATVWWRDYFQYGLGDQIDELIRVRKAFASGDYHALTRPATGAPFWPASNPPNPEHSLYVGQRGGDGPGRGLIVAINKHPSQWAEVWVTQQNAAWRGQTLKDLTGHAGGGTTEVFADGRVRLWAPPRSYTVWVPTSYTLADAPAMPPADAPDYYQVDEAVLQSAASREAVQGEGATFETRAYVHGRTNAPGAAAGVTVWIGWSATDSDPATWTDWTPASYTGDEGHLDAFRATLDLAPGTYRVASRVRVGAGPFRYGGASAAGGGFWDGAENVSATLAVAASLALADGAGWRMLAPPVSGLTVGDLAAQNLVQGSADQYPQGQPNLFVGYDGTAFAPAGADADALRPGYGVAWYLFDNDRTPPPGAFGGGTSASVALPATLAAPGTEPSTDVAVALHDAGDRWNLLGNPFALALDVSGVAGWAGTGALESAVGHVWRCEPDASAPARCVGSYTLTTDPDLGDAVPPWHAVFVQAAAGGAGSLEIPVSARGASGRRAARSLIAFEVAAADGSARDRSAIVVFDEAASAGWDRLDAEKLASLAWPSVAVAFGAERDGEPALKAQESRPVGAAEVPLHVASRGAGGALVLRWPHLTVPAEWSVTLRDLDTGAEVDLRTAESYAFRVAESGARRSGPLALGQTAPADGGPARFALSVRLAATAGETAAEGETWLGAPTPNPSSGGARVAYRLAEAGHARVSVVDLLGREVAVLADGPHGSGESRVALPALPPGVYVVRLVTASGAWTQRAAVVR